MKFINDFLHSISPSRGKELYGLTGTFAMALMVLAVVFYLVRMKAKPLVALKGVVIAAIAYYFTIFAQYFTVWYRVGFSFEQYEQESNLALGFILLPLLSWLCAKTFNTSVGFSGDVVALTLLGFHVIGRSGCVFSGCCYGFPCDWGVFSFHTKANQFPVCFVESLFTLAILIFVIVRICRKGYTPDGKNLPYFLLFYGICRFFSEMTRESTCEDWLFWRISDIHIHMLVMAAVGGYMLWYMHKKERATAMGEESSLPHLKACRK